MKHCAAALLLVFGALLAAAADASHITDKMAVGLYESQDDEQPKRLLTSGTPVEILDRAGRLCRVRLGDGEGGWLECRYISDEKPARTILVEVQARASQLREKVAALTRQLEASRQHNESLELRLQAAEHLLAKRTPGQELLDSAGKAIDSEVALAVRDEILDTNVGAGNRHQWRALGQGAITGFTIAALLFYWRCRKKYGGLRI